MIFDYCHTTGSPARTCTYDEFNHLVDLPQTAELVAACRAGDKGAKQRLPVFCFHAHFPGGRRRSAGAEPSGLVMADFDHLSPEELEMFKSRATSEEFRAEVADTVMLVHVTPSGRGLRVVFKATRRTPFADCRSIGDFQRRFAQLLGGTERLDGVTTDLARCSFCPSRADIVFLDKRLFTDGPEVTAFAHEGAPAPAPAPSPAAPQLTMDSAVQQDFRGVPLDEIFRMYFAMTGGLPAEGERNSRFYAAARDLRYICDFNPRTLAAHMPDVGLGVDEVFSVCQSACQSSRATQLPPAVADAVRAVRADSADEAAPEGGAAAVDTTALPRVFRDFAALFPPAFSDAVVLALLPVMGTLTTRLRARYLDGELHSPSFLTVITAEQASGKSFARRIVHTLLHRIEEEDAAQRAIEKSYREELRLKKNTKEQPEDPHVKVRLVPASISVAQLLRRLDNAKGEHLFSFAEELDTVIKSNRSGAWSEKNDIYRNAFDNATYGQDYLSDNSYSASLPVFYNMLFLGTPRQTERFFNNVENGLVSRCCFATLPDQFGAHMPVFRELSEGVKARLDKQIAQLMEASGEVNLAFVNDALSVWLENQRLQSLRDVDRARDIFRRRAAVIGFRAALTASPLYMLGRQVSRDILTHFACHVADLVLDGQLAFAGTGLNRIIERSARKERARSSAIFDNLPDEFSQSQLASAMNAAELKSPVRQLVYVWIREELITRKEGEKFVYVKVKKNGTKNKKN